jgi:hypothetical protein
MNKSLLQQKKILLQEAFCMGNKKRAEAFSGENQTL